MKRNNILLFFCILFVTWGCSNFDEINTNPDAAVNGNAPMLLTGVEISLMPEITKNFMLPFMAQKSIVWTEGVVSDYQYNRFSRIDFTPYVVIKNIAKMNQVAEKSGYTGVMYEAIGKVIQSYMLFQLTSSVGDIPYSEALQGETEGNYTPVFDSQKSIMQSILKEFEEASNLFKIAEENNESINGDIFYNGDPSAWRKFTNSYYLNLLMSLSKKANDSDLNIKSKFNQVVNNPSEFPLFSSNSDNFQVVYHDKDGEKKPFYVNGFESYAVVSSVVIEKLKELQDYRLFYFADPLPGKNENEFDSYKGLDPSAPNYSNIELYATQQISLINESYYSPAFPEGLPYILFGYSDIQFVLAEAASRGWINYTDQYYKNAVKSALQFRKENTPQKWTHGMPITDAYIADYLEKPEIQLPGNLEGDLELIIGQKYLASFLQNNWNVYFDYRRTGYPQFPINPETNKNTDPNKIPVRWLYPQKEYDYNLENVQNSVQAQFNGKDEVTELMWILKP